MKCPSRYYLNEADQRYYHFMYFLFSTVMKKLPSISIYEIIKIIHVRKTKTCDQGIRPLIYGFYFIFILFEGPVNARSDQFLPFVAG